VFVLFRVLGLLAGGLPLVVLRCVCGCCAAVLPPPWCASWRGACLPGGWGSFLLCFGWLASPLVFVVFGVVSPWGGGPWVGVLCVLCWVCGWLWWWRGCVVPLAGWVATSECPSRLSAFGGVRLGARMWGVGSVVRTFSVGSEFCGVSLVRRKRPLSNSRTAAFVLADDRLSLFSAPPPPLPPALLLPSFPVLLAGVLGPLAGGVRCGLVWVRRRGGGSTTRISSSGPFWPR